jgi:hypothetical protein
MRLPDLGPDGIVGHRHVIALLRLYLDGRPDDFGHYLMEITVEEARYTIAAAIGLLIGQVGLTEEPTGVDLTEFTERLADTVLRIEVEGGSR